ncbi:sodium:proton antiporter [Microbacterium aoyamense]|uniref:Sodium:proton antiporter n=1 Tax=Microbacterium aoyamense TaxID=344166 RepID=A0ABN2PE24_9MICO|nr:sodium:proton antiporter [Microbacterium aoyamense]
MSIEVLLLIVIAVIVIVFASTFASRIGVAGPLVLVAVGVGISLIPAVPAFAVEPALILVGVLPPLLYSSAVSAPAIELRRDLRAIGGLAILLVIVSSVLLGLFFWWAIPGLGLPLGIALGAILSPTDAVATSIVRKQGVPRRVVTLLEGESLLNDATALVLLRTAIAATAAGFSFVATLGAFAWAVLSAVVIGAAAGFLALRLRMWTRNATASTAVGLVVPYLAYLPTDAVGGSGLVAAVVAGVVCGQGAVRWLTPEQRISDRMTWRTVEFILEGAVFLIMGLELWGIVSKNLAADEGLLRGLGIAAAAFVLLILVRGAYVVPMLSFHGARVRRATRRRLDPARAPSERRAGRIRADVDYFESSPLTWRHSVVVTWAGMRGVVTLAAAQTLPRDTPERELLIFIAFAVAAGSLLIQGLTLPAVARLVGLGTATTTALPRRVLRDVDRRLREAAHEAIGSRSLRRAHGTFSDEIYAHPPSRFLTVLDAPEEPSTRESLEFELAVIEVMRARLRQLAASGRYSTTVVRYIFDELDAYEISVKLHLESEG